ncbi:hypothetical protein [Chryseobacterium sp.]|nr:hypothetical protein [Chryseobacterium sp.]
MRKLDKSTFIFFKKLVASGSDVTRFYLCFHDHSTGLSVIIY